jgi:hypothetical protein
MIFQIMMLSLMLAGVSLRAQVGRGPAVHTPEVASDGSVATRLTAAGAQKVVVCGIGERLAMWKDEQRAWSAATVDFDSDLHADASSVDGGNFNDPGNRLFKSSYGSAGQIVSS